MSEKATVVLKDARATPAAPSGQPIELPRIDDYYKWSIEQAAYIRAGRFDLVDLLNVADEIESVGKSEARELRSNLEIVLIHLLKWDQQPQRRGRSWALSIAEHRARFSKLCKKIQVSKSNGIKISIVRITQRVCVPLVRRSWLSNGFPRSVRSIARRS